MERDWSPEELGKQVELSRQVIKPIERGKFDPSLPLAYKLAELFNLPIEEISMRGESDSD